MLGKHQHRAQLLGHVPEEAAPGGHRLYIGLVAGVEQDGAAQTGVQPGVVDQVPKKRKPKKPKKNLNPKKPKKSKNN